MGSLYAMKGKKSKYKFETWTGVGAYSYGYVTFKKSKVITKRVWSFSERTYSATTVLDWI